MSKELKEMGVEFFGICCGNMASYTRTMCEAIGRTPDSSKFTKDMSLHITVLKDGKRDQTAELLGHLTKANE